MSDAGVGAEIVELVARAIADRPWGQLSRNTVNNLLITARAVMKEHLAALAAAGFVVVPREATDEMLKAEGVADAWGECILRAKDTWGLMVEAALAAQGETALDGG